MGLLGAGEAAAGGLGPSLGSTAQTLRSGPSRALTWPRLLTPAVRCLLQGSPCNKDMDVPGDSSKGSVGW